MEKLSTKFISRISKRLRFIIIGVFPLSLSGCKIVQNDLHYNDKTNEIVDIMEQNDTDSINKLLFDESTLLIDEELSEYFIEEEAEEGIISQITSSTSIEVKYIDAINKSIVYEIVAPDMTNVLSDVPEDIVTEDEFASYIERYISEADTVKQSITVAYTEDNGKIMPEYKDPEFINAFTGGFLEAYKAVYKEMINAYLTELEDLE